MFTIGGSVLEVGSNVFELIEFTVTKKTDVDAKAPIVYGVNVAKVREVIRLPEIISIITTCPEVLGMINLRGIPIPVIHLAKALGYKDDKVHSASQVIVTEFAGRVAGFIVAESRRIRRVGWDKVLPPPSETFSSITGMMPIESNQFLFIIDFERIFVDIESSSHALVQNQPGATQAQPTAAAPVQQASTDPAPANAPLVMVVDDSPTARRALADMLKSMKLQTIEYANGQAAWAAIEEGVIQQNQVRAIISDVEMPKLDGYTLVRRIRETEAIKSIPILMHSSLSGEANKERAMSVGADAYVTKFNRKGIMEALKNAIPDWKAA